MLSKFWNRLNGPFNIFENKGKVESMSNEILNSIQYAFNKLSSIFTLSTMLDDLFKRTEHLVQ